MIITKHYANRLIKQGRAVRVGTSHYNKTEYAIVNRLDKQRTDHYEIK